MNIKLPFKVKCVDDESSSLTLGKEYDVVEDGDTVAREV